MNTSPPKTKEEKLSDVWMKLHKLECQIDHLIRERDSRPEAVNSKHTWDMILLYMHRELVDTKGMLVQLIEEEMKS